MDNSHRKGTFVPVSPSQTLQSSDRSSKGSNDCSNISSNKQGVNIQVIVRCRPLNDDERRVNTPAMVTCNEQRREVSSVQNIANKKIDKTFTFDKVFGPSSQQSNLFEQAVSPIVREVLEGYNCTIFAYGQTGTGKTYTMEGGAAKAKINGKFPRDAGVIPRSVRQIFDKLESQNAEYSVKVTFLELYNEEITDLLAPEELRILDDKSKKPIALMEDGKGGVFVRGLEEEIVTTASEIYEILEKGSLKRRTAETLLNKQSSRSHSIFSITIHIKECTPEGEEMIKCGKLNLVDLAGSENISRSGARDNRAREAGEINKSLLTLGRVINALVDHSGHIPYRDSKLTRLLRDSLGGKTKTCIIATISPSIHCLEETLNTLDYAHRAKNIKNKPEINQKMMKSAMIKDLYFEIDRLKQELYAAREKNGVYIPKDFFLQDEALKKATSDKMGSLEVQLELRDKELVGLQDLFNSEKLLNADLSDKLEKTKRQLDEKEHSFSELEQCYKQANFAIKEKQYLISNLLKSEKVLVENALELRSELESTAEDVSVLFSKIARKNKIEDGNKVLLQKFTSQLAEQVGLLHKNVSTSVTQQETHLIQLEEEMRSFISAKIKNTKELHGWLERLEDVFSSGIKSMEGVAAELKINSHSTFEKFNSKISTHSYELGEFFKNIAFEGNHLLNELKGSLTMMEDKLSSFSRKQHEGQLRTLEATRSISKIIASFFCNLDAYATVINKILVEAETVRNKQLQDLEKKLEENAANEKKQFLAKVEEMIENSNSKKKKLVQDTVYSLQKTDGERTSSLLGELSYAQNFTHEMKDKWNLYMLETEKNYHEDTTTIESERMVIEKGLHDCQTMTTSGLQKWDTSCSSLLTLEQSNLSSMESLVKSGMEANELIHSTSSSILLTTLQNNESACKCLLSSIDGSLNLDHKTCENIGSLVIPSRAGLRELQIGHHHNTAGITESAQNYLEKEYMVDEEAHLTPRIINVPTVANIEELRTPAFEELLKSWEAKPDLNKQVGGEGKQFFGSYETQGQHLPKDFRAPLTLRN